MLEQFTFSEAADDLSGWHCRICEEFDPGLKVTTSFLCFLRQFSIEGILKMQIVLARLNQSQVRYFSIIICMQLSLCATYLLPQEW